MDPSAEDDRLALRRNLNDCVLQQGLAAQRVFNLAFDVLGRRHRPESDGVRHADNAGKPLDVGERGVALSRRAHLTGEGDPAVFDFDFDGVAMQARVPGQEPHRTVSKFSVARLTFVWKPDQDLLRDALHAFDGKRGMFGFQFLGKRLDMAGQFDNAAAHRDSDMCRVHTRRPPKVLENISPDRLVSGHILISTSRRGEHLYAHRRRLMCRSISQTGSLVRSLLISRRIFSLTLSVELLSKVSERSRWRDDHERRHSALAHEPV